VSSSDGSPVSSHRGLSCRPLIITKRLVWTIAAGWGRRTPPTRRGQGLRWTR
jgi:hypothetical protein